MSGAAIFDQLGEALRAQRARFGAEAFANRRRVVALLADTLPEARREIRAVASALDEGAVEALTGVERRLLGMEMDRQADRLEQSLGLRPDLARQVIRALAYGLDLGPPPSVYESTLAPAPPPGNQPAPGAQDWAGLSQTTAQPLPQSPQVISPTAYPAAPASNSDGHVLFHIQGRAITRTHAVFAAVAAALVIFGLPMLARSNHTQQTALGYAGELTDVGVAPKNTLETNVGSPTPISIPAGQRLTTLQVRDFTGGNANIVLIDVLADTHPQTIQGAHYLPSAGQPGDFNDPNQARTAQALQNLSGGRRDRPMIFFCAGSSCWESYNAVLRAHAAGYTQLYWYRGGLASWIAANLPMQALPAPSN